VLFVVGSMGLTPVVGVLVERVQVVGVQYRIHEYE
jgi:hypothetical protein